MATLVIKGESRYRTVIRGTSRLRLQEVVIYV